MKKKQFTLVELIIVIVVIAILVAIAMLNVGDWRKEATKSAILSNVKNIQTASDMYNLDGKTDTIGLTKPTLKRPSGIDFDKAIPKYLRAEPKQGKYWIDSNKIVWGATIEPPVVSKEGNTYLFEENKKAEDHHVYEVTVGKKLELVKDAEIKDNSFTGKPGTEYVFSAEDELGLETVPVGDGHVKGEDEVAVCTPDFALPSYNKGAQTTNFVNKIVQRGRSTYFDVIKTSDGNYVAAGKTVGFDSDFSPSDYLTVDKYDKNLILTHTFSLRLEYNDDFYAKKIVEKKDGGFAFVGYTNSASNLRQYTNEPNNFSYNVNSYSPFVASLDKDLGNFKAEVFYRDEYTPEDDVLHDLTIDEKGNILVLGYLPEYRVGEHNYVLKYDKDLKFIEKEDYPIGTILNDIKVDTAGRIFAAGSKDNQASVFELNANLSIKNEVKLGGVAPSSPDGEYTTLVLNADGGIAVYGYSNYDLSALTGKEEYLGRGESHLVAATYSKSLEMMEAVSIGTGYSRDVSGFQSDSVGYSFIYNKHVYQYDKNLNEVSAINIEDFADLSEPFHLKDKNNHIFIDRSFDYSRVSIALFKDLSSSNIVEEYLSIPDRLLISSGLYYIKMGEAPEYSTPDIPEEYYIAGYNADTHSVNPIYSGSVFADIVSYTMYSVESDGKLVEFTGDQNEIENAFYFDLEANTVQLVMGKVPANAPVATPPEKVYYLSGFSQETMKVNPIYAGSAFVADGYGMLVASDGSFVEMTDTPPLYMFSFDPYTGLITPLQGSGVPEGAPIYEESKDDTGLMTKLYKTGYNPETKTMNKILANSVFSESDDTTQYYVDDDGKVTEYPSYYELPEEIRYYATYFNMQGGLDYFYIPSGLYYESEAYSVPTSLETVDVKLNCYTDTYFVNVGTGEIHYIDESGEAINKGIFHGKSSSYFYGENPLDINLYFYDPNTGWLNNLPEGRSFSYS